MIAAMDGILREVGQRVMHPAHVPFHTEPQATHVGRPRHHRPRGRFLRDGLDSRVFLVSLGGELAQKINGFEIFASTELVWNPLSLFSRIVEIEHRSNSIHSQPVDVILIQPEQPARHKKAAHLVAAVVEDERLPVRMEALASIGVFEQVRAVKVGQPMRVGREVRGDPVQNHPNALLVQIVHQVHEVLWSSIARRGREVSSGLVSP